MNLKITLVKSELLAIKVFLLYAFSSENYKFNKTEILNLRAFYYKLEKKLFLVHYKEPKKKFSFNVNVNEFAALEKFNSLAFDLLAAQREYVYESSVLTRIIADLRKQLDSININISQF